MAHLDPDHREEWEAMLMDPIPGGEGKPTPMQIEDEGSGFMDLMGKAGSAGVARGASR